MTKGEKPILSCRISHEAMDGIDELAELAGVSRTEIVERCLLIGIANQEDLVAMFRHPLKAPIVNLLSAPVVMKTLARLFGEEIDPTSEELIKNARGRRHLGKSKPVTE